MGSVTPLGETRRFVPPRLGADVDVLGVARSIASHCVFESGAQIRARIARSGLLSLSVPEEFGGADITNDVLSQAIAIISKADTAAAVAANPQDLASFQTAFKQVTANCGACHQTFRLKK